MIHQRKCHDCGNVAQYSSNITPEVRCRNCGSQDTRIVREKPAEETNVIRLDELIERLRITREHFEGNPPILIKIGWTRVPMRTIDIRPFESVIVLGSD